MICQHKTLRDGIAIENTYRAGLTDFIGTNECVTLSIGGPGKLVRCLKCVACGASFHYAKRVTK